MEITKSAWAAVGTALLLAACGGGGGSAGSQNSNPGRGELMQNPPPRTLALSAAEFTGEIAAAGSSGALLLRLATGSSSGPLPCGIDIQHIKYGTVGAKGEATQASAALMVPTGLGTTCSGARPIVLFAHGTNVEKRFNMADLIDTTNPAHDTAAMVASQFAAMGYIVVAPNYAGYDSSTLGYHPFLVADQQSKDMIDALIAARAALPKLIAPVSDNGKLFITGTSQGGHVTMATHRAMEAAGMTVTASSPAEPVSNLALYGDYIMSGHVPLSSTGLIPMLLTGYQKSYGTLYSNPSEYYEPAYAAGIEAAMPGAQTSDGLLATHTIPMLALFAGPAPDFTTDVPTPGAASIALWTAGFDIGNLITTNARTTYLADAVAHPENAFHTVPSAAATHPLRIKLGLNDMRNWSTGPTSKMLICGGAFDPTVYFSLNSELSANLWQANSSVSILDLENLYPSYLGPNKLSTILGGAYAPLAGGMQGAFAAVVNATKQAVADAGGNATLQAQAVTKDYHGKLVPPVCGAAASKYFATL